MKKKQKKAKQPLLSHRRHTGHSLSSGHTAYPLLIFILLCVGVLLAGLTLPATADEIFVSARVAGEPPSEPAVILSPADNARFTAAPITVSGTCQASMIIKIYRNEFISGAVMCAADGTFSMESDLFPGANDLVARTFNLGDNEGPPSAKITVYRDPPPIVAPPVSDPQPSSVLLIKPDVFYRGSWIGAPIRWNLEITGGQAPYTVYVDWGDESTDVIGLENSDRSAEISHVYYKLPPGGSYAVKLKVVDARGFETYSQVVAVINGNEGGGSAAARPLPRGPLITARRSIWSLYGFILLLTFSFWLGQWREIEILNRRTKFAKGSRMRLHHSARL